MTKTLAKVFGVVFLLVGILGFFSNSIVGSTGYFHTNMAHTIVHLLLGIVLLLASGTEAKAALWLKIVGVVYVLVAILGFAMMGTGTTSNLLGFMEVNAADNWLHIVLGIVIFLCGFAGGKKMMTPGTQM